MLGDESGHPSYRWLVDSPGAPRRSNTTAPTTAWLLHSPTLRIQSRIGSDHDRLPAGLFHEPAIVTDDGDLLMSVEDDEWLLHDNVLDSPAHQGSHRPARDEASYMNLVSMDVDEHEESEIFTMAHMHRQLNQIQANVTQLFDNLQNHQRNTDARLQDLAERVREIREQPHSPRSPPQAGGARREVRKDSSANYLRRCIRKHIALTFAFGQTQVLPRPPSEHEIHHMLRNINLGSEVPKPFRYDWSSPPTSLYNICIENAFSADFWASVESGQYDINLIPPKFRGPDRIVGPYRRHFIHLKKCWTTQQNPPHTSQKVTKARHYARNSRIGTTFRNRRDAAQYLPAPDSARVYDLVKNVGTTGISSDEELPAIPGKGRQYATYDKPWRASSLVHLYRYLDLVHAATRNPNGNPIRTRHRTLRVREPMNVPKGLPIDCYNPLYLNRCSALDLQVLKPKPAVGMDELWMRVQGHGII